MKRQTTTTPVRYRAECAGCAWQSEARNAMGNAARHHDATGHAITVEACRTIVYGNPHAPMDGQVALDLGDELDLEAATA